MMLPAVLSSVNVIMGGKVAAMDRIDRAILKTLQADGRITTNDLAVRVALSPSATADRVRRLQREGYIEGYGARLSPKKLGLDLLVFVEVKLDRTTPDVFDIFARAVERAPEVLECHMVAGGFDYLIKARVADMVAYRSFLSDTLLALPGVRETHTYPVMEEVKATNALPL